MTKLQSKTIGILVKLETCFDELSENSVSNGCVLCFYDQFLFPSIKISQHKMLFFSSSKRSDS